MGVASEDGRERACWVDWDAGADGLREGGSADTDARTFSRLPSASSEGMAMRALGFGRAFLGVGGGEDDMVD